MKILFALAAGLALSGCPPMSAKAQQPVTKNMSFPACLETIRQMATALGIAPTNIVETSIMRVVRLPAADGSLLVTCSAPDQKIVLLPTNKICGVDVVC